MISFIGSGNMATAIVTGLLANKICTPAQVACIGGPADDTAQKLSARTGIRTAATLDDLLSPPPPAPGVDVVVAAIKPQQLADMPPALAGLTRGKLVLSILAGKPLSALAAVFPHARNLVRAMPNTPGAIGAGITGWCSLHPLADADRTLVTNILNSLGKHVELAETQLDAVTGLSGSGPAYVFEFAAALREAGIAAGLPRDTAQLLAIETLLGSARLMSQTGTEPETLRNQVTSPNGTTYAGLQRMAARDFRGLIQETVLAAKTRSEELSR
ncbi:pyrroline-5-carboxylate reductase [Geminisphaera colitermitum]|uniref:pyrroline-5-carboxylate reductase n=1 Tax=Geminisphaera colitermitum TaxID=1148786 RepID=UPI000196501F|nr:pyrroline-5-carboxylate reductase [Geminisphaera colitermitum]